MSLDQASAAWISGVHFPLFLCALRTGMRLGELLGLQWGEIDFNGRFIEVRRSLVAGRETTPKSGKTRRVDMSQSAHRDAAQFAHCTEGRSPPEGVG